MKGRRNIWAASWLLKRNLAGRGQSVLSLLLIKTNAPGEAKKRCLVQFPFIHTPPQTLSIEPRTFGWTSNLYLLICLFVCFLFKTITKSHIAFLLVTLGITLYICNLPESTCIIILPAQTSIQVHASQEQALYLHLLTDMAKDRKTSS